MSQSDAAGTNQLRQRLEQLEIEVADRALSDAYGRFYAPLAIVAVLLSFLPLYQPVMISEDVSRTYESTWEMAARTGGDPAMLGLLLLAGLVVAMCVAATRTKSAALPITIAVLAALLAGMIVLKPGTGTPKPDLTLAAIIGVAFSLVIVAVAVAHTIQLLTRRRPHITAGTGNEHLS